MTAITNLRWKETLKGYKIIFSDNITGTIYNNWILINTKAEIDQKKYIFKKKALFSNTINLLDRETNQRIGELVFSNWRTNARITIGEKVTTWNFNIWKGKWNVNDFDGKEIKFSDGLLKKNITTDSDNYIDKIITIVLSSINLTE